MSFGVHSSVPQDHDNLVLMLQSSKRRSQALVGIRKHGLFGARLKKWHVASPLSVAIFLLILKLFSFSVQSQKCDFKTTVLKRNVLCSLVCFGRREQKVLVRIVFYRYTLMAGA